MQATNQELLAQSANGDHTAFSVLITQNMGLVRSVAQRFTGRGTDYEDLVQIGTIGMMKAARSYDPAFGTAFSTYAVPLIMGEIRRTLRDDGMIKVSRSLKQLGNRALRERDRFCREEGRDPRLTELAERCEVTEGELAEALEAVTPVRSIDEPIGEDGATLGSLLSEQGDAVESLTDRLSLQEAVRTLSETHRKLLYLRYEKEFSQQRTGEILGMTQVKVSREEKKVIALLRTALRLTS